MDDLLLLYICEPMYLGLYLKNCLSTVFSCIHSEGQFLNVLQKHKAEKHFYTYNIGSMNTDKVK